VVYFDSLPLIKRVGLILLPVDFTGICPGIVNIHIYFTPGCAFIRNMKTIIIALGFIAVFYLSGIITNGDVTVQLTVLILSGLAIVWYAMKVICCMCKNSDETSCSKRQSNEPI
jgi:hypothetical protein